MRYFRARNWWKFQKYFTSVENNPPWIKLFNSVLDAGGDSNWKGLDAKQRGELVSIWLLLSRNNGLFPCHPELVASECLLDEPVDLDSLESLGWIIVSGSKAECAIASAEDRASREEEKKSKKIEEEKKNEDRKSTTSLAAEVLNYLNDVSGRDGKNRFRKTAGTLAPIKARLNEGFDVADCKVVIDYRLETWTGKKWDFPDGQRDAEKYLRPSTLFKAGGQGRGPSFAEVLAEARESASQESNRREAIALREAAERRSAAKLEASERDDRVRQHVKWHNDGRPRKILNMEMPAHVWEGMSAFCDELIESGVIKEG